MNYIILVAIFPPNASGAKFKDAHFAFPQLFPPRKERREEANFLPQKISLSSFVRDNLGSAQGVNLRDRKIEKGETTTTTTSVKGTRGSSKKPTVTATATATITATAATTTTNRNSRSNASTQFIPLGNSSSRKSHLSLDFLPRGQKRDGLARRLAALLSCCCCLFESSLPPKTLTERSREE